MKKILLLILLSKSITGYSLEKPICALGAIGGVGSIIFWLPETKLAIQRYGIMGAIHTTHIPRIALDVLLIKLCCDKLCS